MPPARLVLALVMVLLAGCRPEPDFIGRWSAVSGDAEVQITRRETGLVLAIRHFDPVNDRWTARRTTGWLDGDRNLRVATNLSEHVARIDRRGRLHLLSRTYHRED